jgi:hypothetical protein
LANVAGGGPLNFHVKPQTGRAMAHKRNGQLTVSGEWARHLRPYLRRKFWKDERAAERAMLQSAIAQAAGSGTADDTNVVVTNDGDTKSKA